MQPSCVGVSGPDLSLTECRVCRESHQPDWAREGSECGYVNVNRGSHRISREARIPDRYPDQNTIHQRELDHTLNTSHRQRPREFVEGH